jgi:hypothetical protein
LLQSRITDVDLDTGLDDEWIDDGWMGDSS